MTDRDSVALAQEAQRRRDLLRSRCDMLGLCDIELDATEATARLCDQPRAVFLAPYPGEHAPIAAGEPECGGRPDAGGGPGDEHCAVHA